MSEIPLGATVTVISKDKKVLIIQRPKGKTFEGLWTVPGGKFDPIKDGNKISEGFIYYPAEQLAIRELKEETGIEIKQLDLKFICTLLVEKEINRFILSFYVQINKKAKDIKIKLTESNKYHWLSLNEINKYKLIAGISEEIKMALIKSGEN